METNQERPEPAGGEEQPQPGAQPQAEAAAASVPSPGASGQGGNFQRYALTAVVSAGVFLFSLALFIAGFVTHSLTDEDVDLSPIEERLASLEDRTAKMETDLTAALSGQGGAGGQQAQGDQASPEAAVSAASEDDPFWGPEDAAVTIVEFSDFQCPFCRRFSTETLGLIRENYGDEVRFVYRDFPISSLHEHAQKAAEAAQCAHEQGLFWEYHDLLFANQGALTVDDLKGYAQQVGADTDAFNDCLDSGKNQQEVLLDLQDGRTAGITGTPGFIINGVQVSGAQPYETFQQILDQLLAAARG